MAVHGCGGVGLSAVMIASALGANVIAVDLQDDKLALAKQVGAAVTLNASQVASVPEAIREITQGGAHVSMDALGHSVTCVNSVQSLRKLGKHIQVGLLMAEHATPAIPMGRVIGDELEIIGSHGMQAFRYDAMLSMIMSGKLKPEKLLGRTISLAESIEALTTLDTSTTAGVTVISSF